MSTLMYGPEAMNTSRRSTLLSIRSCKDLKIRHLNSICFSLSGASGATAGIRRIMFLESKFRTGPNPLRTTCVLWRCLALYWQCHAQLEITPLLQRKLGRSHRRTYSTRTAIAEPIVLSFAPHDLVPLLNVLGHGSCTKYGVVVLFPLGSHTQNVTGLR